METKLEIGAALDIATGQEVRDAEKRIRGSIFGLQRKPLFVDQVASGQATASASSVVLKFGGPSAGTVWDIRQLLTAGSDDNTTLSAYAISTVGTAAASGTAILPTGAAISGFDINVAPAAAAVTGVVTVTNTAQGTLSYQLSMGTQGGTLSVRYPVPIPAASATSAITVTVPAIVGGAVYTIDAYGNAQVAWYKAISDTVNVGTLLIPRVVIPSSAQPASSESVFLHYGEQLIAVAYGLVSGQSVVGIARIAEWPEKSMEAGMV